MYVLVRTGRYLHYSTHDYPLAKLQKRRVHIARPSDGKVRIKLVTSTCTLSGNVLLQDCTRHTRTLPLLTDLEASREADLRGMGSFNEVVLGTQ
jgi:hypothetical protein